MVGVKTIVIMHSAAGSQGSSVAREAVDLVQEDDGRQVGPGQGEEVADPTLALTHLGGVEGRAAGKREEGAPRQTCGGISMARVGQEAHAHNVAT